LTIIYTQGSYGERFEETKQCVERVQPYVDHVIIVYDDYADEQIKWLLNRGVKAFHHPWEDNFPLMRNQLLDHAREVDPHAWVLTSDPDELFSESLMRNIRNVLTDAWANGFNQLGVNSHDVDVKADGTRDLRVSNFFKMLIFKLDAGQVYYVGVGLCRTVHETLCGDWHPKALSTEYYYEHIKYESKQEVWERGIRNFWIAGGGNNVGAVLPNGKPNTPWFTLHAITDRLGLKRWRDVREYMRRGNIDAELKQWLIEYRDWNEVPEMASELREAFKWYQFLHPDELRGFESRPQSPIKGSWGELRDYVDQCYREVLGRNSDDQGREGYAQAILQGNIKREDLPNILRQSEEYKQRFGGWRRIEL
jgi:hypothetical protein